MNIINLIKKKPSYSLYVISSIILIIVFLISIIFFRSDSHLITNRSIEYVLIPFFTIAFFIDSFYLLKKLWQTIIGKFLYSFLGYFALINSQIFAKNEIYSIVNENPDFYQNSIQLLSAIYLIPSWLILIGLIISLLVIVGIALSYLLMLFNIFIKLDKLTSYMNKILEYFRIKIKIDKHHIFHSGFILVSSMVFLVYMPSILTSLDKNINKKIITKSIIYSSYYPNKICKDLNKNHLIKLIGTNNVSVCRINSNNKPLFKTEQCKR